MRQKRIKLTDIAKKVIDETDISKFFLGSKENLFDENNFLKEKHILTDYTDSSIEKYRRKLNKI